ncbi:arrestin domain-containing protein 3-like [Pecten maximus]|uniref:arrestin domain-containing protein 3-like n=1 Tax=Pecten maximus TaxID=6579 RepID=UPI001458187B|nr:arrestin domain-containing protein 3-like [Pecten maximus]XP_033737484.1 arrestin domain-containing protein 3-like [Pecten maximus]
MSSVHAMDYVKKFEIELDKDVYYAGEVLTGSVIARVTENIKVHGIRLVLRGKAHVEWKINKAGERRNVRDDEYYIDEKRIVWGKDKKDDGPAPIMPRGNHRYPFEFKLPESALPCSLESKMGTIRYYVRGTMDIPYASSPQSVKYFSIIGPHIDCMDERFLTPTRAADKRYTCCMCCTKGPVALDATLERSAYCCGDNIRLKVEMQNGSGQQAWILCRLMQNVEYFINKGVLGLRKDVSHRVWEYKGDSVAPHHTERFDNLQNFLQVPVMPPTLVDVCNLIQIYYTLQVGLVMEDTGEVLELNFPMTIATTPYRITNAPYPIMQYDVAAENVEGGMYISSEFQVGQVYTGDEEENETEMFIIYRPVYICIPHERIKVTNTEKDVNICRAGSRISMTRLDRKTWKMQTTHDSDKEDSSVLDLKTDTLVPDMSDLDLKESMVMKKELSDVAKDIDNSNNFLKPSESHGSMKQTMEYEPGDKDNIVVVVQPEPHSSLQLEPENKDSEEVLQNIVND